MKRFSGETLTYISDISSVNIRILVISNYSGPENPIRAEAEIYLGLVKLGFQIWVMTPTGGTYPKRLAEAGCQLIDFRPSSKFDRNAVQRIRNIVRSERIEIVHAFYSKAIACAAWALWRNQNVKLISYRGYTGNIRWYDPTNYLSFLNPRLDYMVCLAESVRTQYLKSGVPASKAITIHKGHDDSWYASVLSADLSEFKFPKDSIICAFVANGRIKMKGVKYLVEAVAQIKDRWPIYVLMIGTELFTPEIEHLLRQTGSAQRFVFTGFRKDSLSLVKACHISISTSLFGEATQKAVIEAMYLGNPVIITDIEGNKGMVEDGISGIIVPPADSQALAQAIEKMAQSPSLRQKLSEKGKQHIKSFLSVEKTITEYAQFYREILSKKNDANI